MTLDSLLVLLPALFFAGMGGVGLFAPLRIARIFGAEARTADSRIELQAVYGGFGIAVAALLLMAVRSSSSLRVGLTLAIALCTCGMAFGRLFGWVSGGKGSTRAQAVFLVVELWITLSLGAWAWQHASGASAPV